MTMRRTAALILLVVAIACTHRQDSQSPTLRIYVARHGQTDWNLTKRLQGQTDTELNETGRKQARALAERMRGIPIERVYSSLLRRSRVTAEIAAQGAPVESLPTLNEQSLGRFEGLYVDGRDSANEQEFRRRARVEDDSLDGGESARQFFVRVCGATERIRGRHSSGSILIVGHGETNSMILRCLLGLTFEQADAIEQANDELYLIELSPARDPRLWKLIPGDKLGEL